MNSTTLIGKTSLVATTAVAALVLAGCGSTHTGTTAGGTHSGGTHASTAAEASASYGPPAAGPHNAQDVGFVKDMLPHHSQAVEMADMALSRDTTPQVKALARQIKNAQAPEINAMGGWLTGWGEKIPATHSMGSMSMGGMSGGTGMMDAQQMTSLDKATGAVFAKMWLTDMTEHHTGAITMARTEQTSGRNPDAKQLASSIIASQTAEITRMKELLAGLA